MVLDATVGLGGHAQAILERIGPEGFLVGIDRDDQALEEAQQRLGAYAKQMKLLKGSFGQAAQLLAQAGRHSLEAVLFDLGVSSLQLEKADRGFSFLREGPLDMRMDLSQARTAQELVNHTSLKELTDLLRNLGEERWAGRMARAIVRARPLTTTTELAQVIRGAVAPFARRGRIDPATRSFQALRIAVNQELEELTQGLAQALELVKAGGRIAVLSYHSLEDRIVKGNFRDWAREGKVELLTRKPMTPSEAEVARNPRSRSARLRIVQRAG